MPSEVTDANLYSLLIHDGPSLCEAASGGILENLVATALPLHSLPELQYEPTS